MNKYTFNFDEIISGVIVIEAEREPSQSEIIERILNGEADYFNTDFEKFELVETERIKPVKRHVRDDAS